MADSVAPSRIQQLLQAAAQAGWSGVNLIRIVATALAESRGVFSVNTSPAALCAQGGCPTGILQIKPGYWGQYGNVNTDVGSFQAALAVLQQQGWGAWETNTVAPGQNSYLDFVPQVEAALGGTGVMGNAPASPSVTSVGTALADNPVGGAIQGAVGNAISGAFSGLFGHDLFKTVGIFIAGVIILGVGLFLLAGESGQRVIVQAGKAAAA